MNAPRHSSCVEGRALKRRALLSLSVPVLAIVAYTVTPAAASPSAQGSPRTQSDSAYASSFAANNVTNVFATSQKTSCYRPEVNYAVNNGPNDGYDGMTACSGANTG